MKKYIIAIVFMFTFLFPFVSIHASETFNQCVQEKNLIQSKGQNSFQILANNISGGSANRIYTDVLYSKIIQCDALPDAPNPLPSTLPNNMVLSPLQLTVTIEKEIPAQYQAVAIAYMNDPSGTLKADPNGKPIYVPPTSVIIPASTPVNNVSVSSVPVITLAPAQTIPSVIITSNDSPDLSALKNTVNSLIIQIASLQAQITALQSSPTRLVIDGCGSRTTGFSVTTGHSCIGNMGK